MHIPSARAAAAVAASIMILSACVDTHQNQRTATVPFAQLFGSADTIRLAPKPDDPVLYVASALVSDSEVLLVDNRAANVKVFDRRSGALVRVLGRAGDAPGEFRRPIAIAGLDSGKSVIYDQGRRVLSFRDAAGNVLGESPMLQGFFNGLVALPGESRVLLSGQTYSQSGETRAKDLHEFDFTGRRVRSYAETVRPKSQWDMKFAAVFATLMGRDIVTGSMNSNRLRLFDPATQHTSWITVAPDWYRPLEYPSDALLQSHVSQQTVAQRVTKWTIGQHLTNAVFPLADGRLLVRFMDFVSPGNRVFNYAVVDSSGRTFAVSQATRSNILATRGDTAFWIDGDPGAPRLGTGVLSVARMTSAARAARAAAVRVASR